MQTSEFLKNVEYLVIGGYAVGYHGYPRATNDIDVFIAVHSNTKISGALQIRKFLLNLQQNDTDIF